MARYYLGVDVGATRSRVALVDPSGTILRKATFKTPSQGGSDVVARAVAEEARRLCGDLLVHVRAVGVGTIGPLDLSRGAVVNTPNLPLRSFEIGPPLQEELKVPVVVVNDCVAGVWGEKVFGLGRGRNNVVYVTLSTGIGGGMVVDGHLLVGKRGNAHEVGHMVIDVEGKMVCGCGGRGHWEAYAGGANIPKFVATLLEEWDLSAEERGSALYRAYTEGRLTPELLYGEARAGDRLALRVVEHINKYNLAGIMSLVNLYDPEVVVLGGSIALKNRELVVSPLKERLQRALGLVTEPPLLEAAALGEDSVLIGAAALAMGPPRHLLKALRYLAYELPEWGAGQVGGVEV